MFYVYSESPSDILECVVIQSQNYSPRPITDLSNLTTTVVAGQRFPAMPRQPLYAPLWATSPRTPETDALLLSNGLSSSWNTTILRVVRLGRVVMQDHFTMPIVRWCVMFVAALHPS